jgi:hypothetical protein
MSKTSLVIILLATIALAFLVPAVSGVSLFTRRLKHPVRMACMDLTSVPFNRIHQHQLGATLGVGLAVHTILEIWTSPPTVTEDQEVS